MNTGHVTRRSLALLPLMGLAACGPAGGGGPSTALAPERQQFGEPQVEVTDSARTPVQAIGGALISGSGAVPVIILKSKARYVENVFKTLPTMGLCTTLMNDLVKRVRSSENKGPASYYCVPVQNGKFGSPMLVAQYES